MTTAWTAEQAQATSSAPLAAAIPAAWASPQLRAEAATGPLWGDSAANAARSAAVCAAALAPTSAPTSTATRPAISTNPANANPTRVAPPSSPTVAPPAEGAVRTGDGALIGRGAGVVPVRGRRRRRP